MKKLINLIALVMLVSTNVLTPFSYAQVETPELIPGSELETVDESFGESGGTPEINEETSEVNEETPELVSEEKGELEQGRVEDVAPENVLPDIQNDVETPSTDETEEEDTESDEVVQPVEEISENEIQDEEEKIEELEKVEKAVVMDIIPGTIVTLLPGQQFNSVIKTLANGGTYVAYTGVDNNIQSFQRVDVEPAGVTTGEISIAGSEYPVHAWFSGGVLYYITKAETIQLNEDSQNMFQNFGALTELDLSSFDTSNVTNMGGMFSNCDKIEELNLSGWDFRNAISDGLIMKLFSSEYYRYKVKNLNLTNAKFTGSMNSAFMHMESLEEINLDGVDTKGVTNMSQMFMFDNKITTLDLSDFDTSNVTNMQYMFYDCDGLTQLDLSDFDTSNVTSSIGLNGMFSSCGHLEDLNLSGWIFNNGNGNNLIYNLFSGSPSQLKKLNLSNTTFTGSMAYAFRDLKNLEYVQFDGINTKGVSDMSYMFFFSNGLMQLDLSSFDTSNVVNMNSMFYGCSSLTGLDLSNFDTSNVTSMGNMFNSCSGLQNLNLDNWVILSVSAISSMFFGDSNLKTVSMKNWTIPKTFTSAIGCRNSQLCSSNLESLDVSNRNFSGTNNLNGLFGDLRAKEIRGLDTWDTSGIQNMGYMFQNCSNLTELDLNGWDVSNVTDMNLMFYGCSSLTGLNLSGWNTRGVTNMEAMFNSCSNLISLNLSNRNTSNLTNMSNIFGGCDNLEDLNLGGWDFKKINLAGSYNPIKSISSLKRLNMSYAKFSGSMNLMFNNMNLEYVDLNGADVSRVTDMGSVFNGCKKLREVNLRGWNTSNVTNMNSMFYYCSSLTGLDLSSFDTNRVIDMTYLFGNCSSLEKLNLDNWSFYGNPTVYSMFFDNSSLRILSAKNWEIPEIFSEKLGCGSTNLCSNSLDTIDVTNWDLSRTKNLYGLFKNSKVKNIKGLDTWDTSGVTNMGDMFYLCNNLTGLDLSSWDTSKVTNMSYMFNGCSKLENLNLDNWDFNKITNMGRMSSMFFNTSSLKKLSARNWVIPENFTNLITTAQLYGTGLSIDVSNWDLSNAKNLQHLFGNSTAREIKGLNTWDTSGIINMRGVFHYCSNLTGLDLSSRDTSNVINMFGMFQGCSNLTGLDLSNFDTSNVENMDIMFRDCSKLEELNMSGWDFRKSTSRFMPTLFGGTQSLLKKLNMVNTKYSGDATYAFGGLDKLEELNLDGADTRGVTNMTAMFNGDSKLKDLDLSSFDTSNVTNMPQMFYNCSGLNELDLTNFNTPKVTVMGQMFFNTPNLKTIYASEKFVTTALSGDTSSKDMFSGTVSVIGGNGTKFDSNYIDEEYAKIDKVGQTGYFTDKNVITVKFINTLDGIETISTFKKGQKLTPPSVNGYHAVGGYLDEAMTQKIDLNNGVDSYSVVYVKYERNGSSGGGGGGGSSKDTDKDTHGSAEDSQKNSEENGGKEIPPVSPLTEGGLEQPEGQTGSQQPLSPTDSSPDSEQTVTPLIGGDGEARGGGTQSYSPEFQQAYKFAHENGITSKDTIQSAQMNGKLTRIAMAKMLSQYAMNVLGQTPDTSKIVKFSDVTAKRDADYDNGVTLAYQLGIMGQNMPGNKFRPNDEVSRAEFATALSRLLYQTTDGKYKSTKEYYIPHMAKLYNEGIISNTDPSMSERRGYVMIMLMRSAK